MSDAGKRLIGAAEEALAIASGDADARTYEIHVPTTIDVREIRRGLRLSQVSFGRRYGFGVARVRDWEQGRTKPDAANRAFLTVIQRQPDMVLEALEAQDL